MILARLSELIGAVREQTRTLGSDVSTLKLYLGGGFEKVREDLKGIGQLTGRSHCGSERADALDEGPGPD